MRVLQLMAGASKGGAETFFSRLAIALQSRDIDQRVVIRPDIERERLLRDAGLSVATAQFGKWFDFATSRTVKREIGDFQPDIVLTWMNRATMSCPSVTGEKGFCHVGTPRGYYDPKYYRRCDHLVVTTDDLARFYGDHGWPSDRVSVIPNFAPFNPMPAVSRADLETPPDAIVLLALGRLHRNKGFDTLLTSLVDLPEHFLWIGGTGPLDTDLRGMAQTLGVADRVRFLGWRPDAAALFAAADVFVCSSRHEPFGNIVIEAWMYGTPLVAAASEGPAALIEDGVTGLLIPVDDSDAMSGAIRRLVADPVFASGLAAGGRRQYETRYSQDVVLPQYLAMFEDLAN